jgi:hypothetical protein
MNRLLDYKMVSATSASEVEASFAPTAGRLGLHGSPCCARVFCQALIKRAASDATPAPPRKFPLLSSQNLELSTSGDDSAAGESSLRDSVDACSTSALRIGPGKFLENAQTIRFFAVEAVWQL